jgi:hypothetical protein
MYRLRKNIGNNSTYDSLKKIIKTSRNKLKKRSETLAQRKYKVLNKEIKEDYK